VKAFDFTVWIHSYIKKLLKQPRGTGRVSRGAYRDSRPRSIVHLRALSVARDVAAVVIDTAKKRARYFIGLSARGLVAIDVTHQLSTPSKKRCPRQCQTRIDKAVSAWAIYSRSAPLKRVTAIADRDPATPPDVRPSTENRDDDPGEDNAEVLCYDARSILIHRQADCRLQILEMYHCNGKA
jgi:hypothetical protein